MKLEYEHQITQLNDWMREINYSFKTGRQISLGITQTNNIGLYIDKIATCIKHEYPTYSRKLVDIRQNLFNIPLNNPYVPITINPVAYGELYIIISHINEEPLNTRLWQDIHPKIKAVSADLYNDLYYASAVDVAYKEVESTMRFMFRKYTNNASEPKDVSVIIDALISEKGLHHFCDTSDKNGKNYCEGIKQIFHGAFSAFRNPSAHENIPLSQREAIERITLASQMMYILDIK